ncbi:MAG: hypothetical protein HC899_37890 [Leptolyngbyaceae cyanobacterium SM1_4_3]|nr:hypothetical protein [Leptolyngbyaceae cyanobacterium SM1_4_3]
MKQIERDRFRYSDIEFGRASAEAESYDVPSLLTDGYLDAEGISNEALTGSKFLFLGYKGSGKTSLGKHLFLLSEKNPCFLLSIFFVRFSL